MIHLRTIAFGLDDDDERRLAQNDNKTVANILAMAQAKLVKGEYPPNTVESVMKLGGGAVKVVEEPEYVTTT